VQQPTIARRYLIVLPSATPRSDRANQLSAKHPNLELKQVSYAGLAAMIGLIGGQPASAEDDANTPPMTQSLGERLINLDATIIQKCADQASAIIKDDSHRLVVSINVAQATRSGKWDSIVRIPINIESEEGGLLYKYKTAICWGSEQSLAVKLAEGPLPTNEEGYPSFSPKNESKVR
jgi:hypothetical protein